MRQLGKVLLPVIAIAAGAWYLAAPGHDGDSPWTASTLSGTSSPPPSPRTGDTTPGDGPAQAAGTGALVSPFGRGAPAPARPMAERIRERHATMRTLGIDTPESYYLTPVHTLRAQAENNDVMAMLQLAVRYGTESADLEHDAGYDPAIDPRAEQKKYLTAAFNAGHIRSAALLASLYWQERAAIDAYAWHILAERLGDRSGNAWGREAFAALTPAHRQVAQTKAQALFDRANQRFVSR